MTDRSSEPARPTVTLRPIGDADLEFLYRVYASTREEEMRMVDWSAEQKVAFLWMQFEAQHKHYMEHFPDAEYSLVLLDGEAGGRLYLDRREEEIRVVDIALLPERRGSGVGGWLMRRVLSEAASVGKKVRIHVERNNPALRLYERLGFTQIEDQGVYLLMEWAGEG